MAFSFELVRHGARAPIEDRNLDQFPVSEGMLTPEGMRQRYLLGRRNRERYVTEWALINATMVPDEVLMISTDVNRTIQSGYSEFMGLYPPNIESGAPSLKANMTDTVDDTVFKVRN